MARIDCTKYSVNKDWKNRVKNASYLTEAEKQQLISKAHKEVAIENVKEAVGVIVQIIGAVILSGLVYLGYLWLTGRL